MKGFYLDVFVDFHLLFQHRNFFFSGMKENFSRTCCIFDFDLHRLLSYSYHVLYVMSLIVDMYRSAQYTLIQ